MVLKEKKKFVTIDIERENCLYERDRGSLDLKDLYVASGKLLRKLHEKICSLALDEGVPLNLLV